MQIHHNYRGVKFDIINATIKVTYVGRSLHVRHLLDTSGIQTFLFLHTEFFFLKHSFNISVPIYLFNCRELHKGSLKKNLSYLLIFFKFP